MAKLTILVIVSFFYGIAVEKYEIFPYQTLKWLKNIIYEESNSVKKNSLTAVNVVLFEEFSPKADIAFIGDSLTHGGRWNEYFPGYTIVNRGIGGDTTTDILNRLSTVLSTAPKRAYIMAGINDIQKYRGIDDILDAYTQIIDVLRQNQIEVILQSTIQCQKSVCGDAHVRSVSDLNSKLHKLADHKGVLFLDLGKLSAAQGLSPPYTTDGYHLSAEGYVYWIELIGESLAE